ncbi:unnamed protein product [Caenorhabditis sp. 36 PRJEB53466]|nr:unnamed protein product [Caenorhabditis sp. 36 PRJEB53466]
MNTVLKNSGNAPKMRQALKTPCAQALAEDGPSQQSIDFRAMSHQFYDLTIGIPHFIPSREKMQPLLLFSLPYLALKRITSQMDVLDLVDLSLCSKKAYKLVKGMHLRAEKLEVSMDSRIALTFKKKKSTYQIGSYMNYFALEETPIRMVRGHRFYTLHNGKPLFMHLVWSGRNVWDGYVIFIEYLMDIFHTRITRLTIKRTTRQNVLEVCCRQIFRNVDHLFVGPTGDIGIKPILETVTITKSAELHLFSGNECVDGIDLDTLIINVPSWSNPEYLFKCRCRLLEISGTIFPETVVNSYVFRWILGEFPKLERLKVTMQRIDYERIVMDLPFVDCQPNRTEGPGGTVDIVHAEIEKHFRSVDGKMATLVADRTSMHFCVWKPL